MSCLPCEQVRGWRASLLVGNFLWHVCPTLAQPSNTFTALLTPPLLNPLDLITLFLKSSPLPRTPAFHSPHPLISTEPSFATNTILTSNPWNQQVWWYSMWLYHRLSQDHWPGLSRGWTLRSCELSTASSLKHSPAPLHKSWEQPRPLRWLWSTASLPPFPLSKESRKNSDISLKATVILQNLYLLLKLKYLFQGFPGGSVVKNPPANARDIGLIPGPGGTHMLQSN